MKVLPDTSALISYFCNPEKREAFEERMQRPLLFISSIVALELFAGCHTRAQEKALVTFLKPFEKANRIVEPDHATCREVGRVLAGLGRDGIEKPYRRHLINDALIAVSAARSGMVVITANAVDFSLLSRYTPVRWLLIE